MTSFKSCKCVRMIMLRNAMKSQCSKFSTINREHIQIRLTLGHARCVFACESQFRKLKFTFGNTPWITSTAHFAAINFDHSIGADYCEWHTTSELAQRFRFLFVFEWFGKIVDFNFVLSNFVENLSKHASIESD